MRLTLNVKDGGLRLTWGQPYTNTVPQSVKLKDFLANRAYVVAPHNLPTPHVFGCGCTQSASTSENHIIRFAAAVALRMVFGHWPFPSVKVALAKLQAKLVCSIRHRLKKKTGTKRRCR